MPHNHRLACYHFAMETESKRTVRVGVQCIVRRGNQLLMVQRNRGFGTGTWCFPGGHLELDETLVECAIRELREETGIEARVGKVIAITDPLPASGYHMQIGVEIPDWEGEPRIVDPAECRAIGFFPEEGLPENIFISSISLAEKVRKGILY